VSDWDWRPGARWLVERVTASAEARVAARHVRLPAVGHDSAAERAREVTGQVVAAKPDHVAVAGHQREAA
jgi:hypothetical protein